jgi:hypothetical protein
MCVVFVSISGFLSVYSTEIVRILEAENRLRLRTLKWIAIAVFILNILKQCGVNNFTSLTQQLLGADLVFLHHHHRHISSLFQAMKLASLILTKQYRCSNKQRILHHLHLKLTR